MAPPRHHGAGPGRVTAVVGAALLLFLVNVAVLVVHMGAPSADLKNSDTQTNGRRGGGTSDVMVVVTLDGERPMQHTLQLVQMLTARQVEMVLMTATAGAGTCGSVDAGYRMACVEHERQTAAVRTALQKRSYKAYTLLLSERVGWTGSAEQLEEGLASFVAAAKRADAVLASPLLLSANSGGSAVFAAGMGMSRSPYKTNNTYTLTRRLEGYPFNSDVLNDVTRVAAPAADAVLFKTAAHLAIQSRRGGDHDPSTLDQYWASIATRLLPTPSLYIPSQLAFTVHTEYVTTKAGIRQVESLYKSTHPIDMSVMWDGYLNDCTGWASEAISFVLHLERKLDYLAIVGDDSFCPGYPASTMQSLHRMRELVLDRPMDFWVSHKPPPSYPRFPYNGLRKVATRPPVVIGRSMVESIVLPAAWANHTERVDEIWVPSSFLVDVFVNGGVPASKVRVIPEAVDTHLFDPSITEPLALEQPRGFNFLSIFKWEERKGYDVLLRAFASAFDASDDVCLFIHTYQFDAALPSDRRNPKAIMKRIKDYLASIDGGKDDSDLPCIQVLTDVLPRMDMPRLYRAADAFVLPTRGEGWGLPIMEAMAMGLPAIATNFSGQLDFMTEENSYLIEVEAMEHPASSTYDRSLLWARASWTHLASILRSVVDNPSDARRKGALAREHIVQSFNEEKISDMIADRLLFLRKGFKDTAA